MVSRISFIKYAVKPIPLGGGYKANTLNVVINIFGGRAGRVSLWSGKGSSAHVEAGTHLWYDSLESLPIGIPPTLGGEDVK